MIIFLLAPDKIRKMVAIVLVLPIIMVIFFSLLIYQQMAPADAPYIEQVKQIDPWNYFQYFPIVFPVLMLLIMLPLFIWVFLFMYSTFFSREKILKNGISAMAKVISVTSQGMSVSGEPVFKITLEVNSPSQGTYQVTKNFFVPRMDLGQLEVGQTVKVKIDLNNKKNVVFDTWTGDIK